MVITEERVLEILGLLLRETPGHSESDLRGPIGLNFWSKEHGPLIAISTNANIINDLYRHLQTKITLAERG